MSAGTLLDISYTWKKFHLVDFSSVYNWSYHGEGSTLEKKFTASKTHIYMFYWRFSTPKSEVPVMDLMTVHAQWVVNTLYSPLCILC